MYCYFTVSHFHHFIRKVICHVDLHASSLYTSIQIHFYNSLSPSLRFLFGLMARAMESVLDSDFSKFFELVCLFTKTVRVRPSSNAEA